MKSMVVARPAWCNARTRSAANTKLPLRIATTAISPGIVAAISLASASMRVAIAAAENSTQGAGRVTGGPALLLLFVERDRDPPRRRRRLGDRGVEGDRLAGL